jgi:hypothetical protein
MDVEGDDREANELINEFARNTPHPMFRSSKSVHHLFVSPDPTITVCKIGQIEFRGQRHQSVLPPSVHRSGVKYAWLKESAFPAPPMPNRLVTLLYQNRKVIKYGKPKTAKKKSNHVKTVCNKCRRKVYLHKKRLILEVKASAVLGNPWMCQQCRSVDLRPLCREIRDQLNAQDS